MFSLYYIDSDVTSKSLTTHGCVTRREMVKRSKLFLIYKQHKDIYFSWSERLPSHVSEKKQNYQKHKGVLPAAKEVINQ